MVKFNLAFAKEEGRGRGGAGSGCLLTVGGGADFAGSGPSTEGGGADVPGSSFPLMVRVDLVVAKEEGGAAVNHINTESNVPRDTNFSSSNGFVLYK